MSLKSIRNGILKLLGIKSGCAHKFSGRASYPRRYANVPVAEGSASSGVKATRAGAVHWVGKPGTGGWARAARRQAG